MNQRPVLEVSLAQPSWLKGLPWVLMVLVLAGLAVTPLGWLYALAIIGFCGAMTWRHCRRLQRLASYTALRIYSNDTFALVDAHGVELPVSAPGNLWVTRHLIVLQLQTTTGRYEAVAVASHANDPDSFRRFSLLCRNQFAVAGSEGQNVSATQHQRSTL